MIKMIMMTIFAICILWRVCISLFHQKALTSGHWQATMQSQRFDSNKLKIWTNSAEIRWFCWAGSWWRKGGSHKGVYLGFWPKPEIQVQKFRIKISTMTCWHYWLEFDGNKLNTKVSIKTLQISLYRQFCNCNNL